MIHLIAACGLNGEIGYKNQLLCKLSNDMKHFKDLTIGNTVVMGRKTYESIGKPLSERTNIILSHNINYDPHPTTYTYISIEDIRHEYENYANKEIDIFVIGGSQIYKQFLEYADYLHITVIHNTFNKADAYFPKFSLDDFEVISNVSHEADDQNEYSHSFVTYKRRIK